MPRKRVKVELTQKEAEELYLVALNGYDDGDFYGTGYGGKREENAFMRAIDKMIDALEKVRTKK